MTLELNTQKIIITAFKEDPVIKMNKNGNFYCGFWIVANVIIFDLVHFDTAVNSMSAVLILVVGMSTFQFFFY